jgi:hypothetical protein
MSDVFISYSRKDIAFARLLHNALEESDLETWIDWQDIPPSPDWLAEVYEAIEAADTFIFVINCTSVASDICRLEIIHAEKNNQGLIPSRRLYKPAAGPGATSAWLNGRSVTWGEDYRSTCPEYG